MSPALESSQADRESERKHPDSSAGESRHDASLAAIGGVFSGLRADGSGDGNSLLQRRANGEMRALVMRRLQQGVGNHRTQQIVTVMRRPAALQRSCQCGGTCERCKAEEEESRNGSQATVQMRATSQAPNSPSLDQVRPSSSQGEPFDHASRTNLESYYGADFHDVRIHDDAPASQAARSLHADAYTIGRDIYFAEGQYQPESREGTRLLAHELAHVQQQANGQAPTDVYASPDQGVAVASPSDPLEKQAENAADGAVNQRSGPGQPPGAMPPDAMDDGKPPAAPPQPTPAQQATPQAPPAPQTPATPQAKAKPDQPPTPGPAAGPTVAAAPKSVPAQAKPAPAGPADLPAPMAGEPEPIPEPQVDGPLGEPAINNPARVEAVQGDMALALARLDQRVVMARDQLQKDAAAAESQIAASTALAKAGVISDSANAKEQISAQFTRAKAEAAKIFSASASDIKGLLNQAQAKVSAAQAAQLSRLTGGSSTPLGKLRDAGTNHDRDATAIGEKEATRATSSSAKMAGQAESLGASRAAAAPADVREALGPGLQKLGTETASHIRNTGDDAAKGARDTASKTQGTFAKQSKQMYTDAQDAVNQAQTKLQGSDKPVLEKIAKVMSEVLPKLLKAHQDVVLKLDEAEKDAIAQVGESQAAVLTQLDTSSREGAKAVQDQAKANDRQITQFAQTARDRLRAESKPSPKALRKMEIAVENALDQRVAAFSGALDQSVAKYSESLAQSRQGYADGLAKMAGSVGEKASGINRELEGRLSEAKSAIEEQMNQLVDAYTSGVTQAVGETLGQLDEMNATIDTATSQALDKTKLEIAKAVDQALDHNQKELDALPAKMDELQTKTVNAKKKGFWAKVWNAIKEILSSVMFWVGVLLMVVVIAVGIFFGSVVALIVGLIIMIPFMIITVYHRIKSLWQDNAPWYVKLNYFIMILNPFTGPLFILIDTMGLFGLIEGAFGVDIVTNRKLSEDEAARRMAGGIVGAVMLLISLGLGKVAPVKGGGVEPPIRPGETPPVDIPPGELPGGKPPSAGPVEVPPKTPADVPPADTPGKPPTGLPPETPPKTPVDTPPAETPPKTPADTPPAETPPGGKPPARQTPAEKPPGEEPAGEKPSSDESGGRRVRTEDGKHDIRSGPDGLELCSNCPLFRKEYAEELNADKSLSKKLSQVEKMAEETPAQKAAKDAAEKDLQTKLEAARLKRFEASKAALDQALKEIDDVLKADPKRHATAEARKTALRTGLGEDIARLKADRDGMVELGENDALLRKDAIAELDQTANRAREIRARIDTELPRFIRENLIPTDDETFLKSDQYKRTSLVVKGARVYEGPDGRYYHRDTLHTGEAAEIEVYNSQGEHLGTLDPETGQPKGPAVPRRVLRGL